nr:DUF4869 domain-containing protein [uncultured Blautia sp.]
MCDRAILPGIFHASKRINCAKWILKIAEKKDLTVYLQHIMRVEGEFNIILCIYLR